jgi:REP element-mobilizing transposase RayT
MPHFDPYTIENTAAAYQLRWSLALFPTTSLPNQLDWINELSSRCEPDGIRVLEGSVSNAGSLFLLLSTLPAVKPSFMVQRVKGRLQHLLRERGGIDWKRNFRLSTIGDANADTVDRYVADQLGHHRLASPTSEAALANAAWHDPSVDVTAPINSSHGQYVLGLHGVLVHAERWRTAIPSFVDRTRQAALSALQEFDCQASRIALLADHLHYTVRFHYDVAPAEIALLMMNRIRESHDGLRLWMDSFYVGSIGPYDMNAVRR